MTTATPAQDPQAFLRGLFAAAVARAQPAHTLAPFLPPPPTGRTVVIGAGKASGAMAAALDALWPPQAPLSGLVVTRYGHVPTAYRSAPGRIEVVEAAHPVPDAAGQRAAQRMAALLQGLGAGDLVIALVSGGGFLFYLSGAQPSLPLLAGLALGGAAGVLGGNALAQRLGGRTLQRLFALMLVAVSLSLAAQKLLGGH